MCLQNKNHKDTSDVLLANQHSIWLCQTSVLYQKRVKQTKSRTKPKLSHLGFLSKKYCVKHMQIVVWLSPGQLESHWNSFTISDKKKMPVYCNNKVKWKLKHVQQIISLAKQSERVCPLKCVLEPLTIMP